MNTVFRLLDKGHGNCEAWTDFFLRHLGGIQGVVANKIPVVPSTKIPARAGGNLILVKNWGLVQWAGIFPVSALTLGVLSGRSSLALAGALPGLINTLRTLDQVLGGREPPAPVGGPQSRCGPRSTALPCMVSLPAAFGLPQTNGVTTRNIGPISTSSMRGTLPSGETTGGYRRSG